MEQIPKTVAAYGHKLGNLTSIAVRMPQATFDEVKARAIKNNRSISAQIRDDVETMTQVEKDIEEE